MSACKYDDECDPRFRTNCQCDKDERERLIDMLLPHYSAGLSYVQNRFQNFTLNELRSMAKFWRYLSDRKMKSLQPKECPHGDNCACAIGTRHFWFEAYCELRDKVEAVHESTSALHQALQAGR